LRDQILVTQTAGATARAVTDLAQDSLAPDYEPDPRRGFGQPVDQAHQA
jgi:hypothetical protein